MAQTKQPIEYRLLVQPTYDETLKKAGTLFLLETSKQFTNFSYAIDVKDDVEGNNVVWTLHGLRAPSMNMPSTGAAQFRKVYFGLPKSVSFTLVKKGKNKAVTDLKFARSAYTSGRSVSAFLKIYTDERSFEENRAGDVVIAELKPDLHREPPKKKQPPQTKRRT
ncbi:MAG: hypothetical protein HUU02_01010 [Bacteroidetes bacterium]|nr:hypothetical protein [Bacteroidota bacterium]